MQNQYPLWKYLLILSIIILAAIYASPVLFSKDPALQVTGASASIEIDERTIRRIKNGLTKENLSAEIESTDESSVLLRFKNVEDQARSKKVLKGLLGDKYIVAHSSALNTPDWLKEMGAKPMKLGLDLSGGIHFLLEVDVSAAIEPRLKSYRSIFIKDFRDNKLKSRAIEIDQQQLKIRFDDEATRDAVASHISRNYIEFNASNKLEDGNLFLVLSLTEQKLKEIRTYAINQNLTTLRNRVNELGVSEPLVQVQGANRIVVELPGIQDTAAAKRIIGRTASLEFRLEDWKHTGREAVSGPVPIGTERFPFKENRRPPVLVKKRVIVTGDRVVGAKMGFDENSLPEVSIKLDSRGGKQMHAVTRGHIGKKMAVIFVEYKTRVKEVMKDGEKVSIPITSEEKYVINVATIQSALGFNFRITGLDNVNEAQELALLLRSGALAAPMYFVEERTVGPSLGKENIASGLNSIMFGFAVVMIFMVVYYRVFGLIANIALSLNLVILIAIMSMLDAILTLPGMAGFVLLGGMAVDANVIIFSRIKEELAEGETPQAAIAAGYDRAFTAIIDANITTIAVAGVLFLLATGSVKGFAVTLAFGIVSSLFTSIVVTRALVNLVYGSRSLKTLRI